MNRFAPESVRDLAAKIAMAAGVADEDAKILADSLVAADLSGASTHGISRLAIYIKRIQKGLIDPKAKLTITRQHASDTMGPKALFWVIENIRARSAFR